MMPLSETAHGVTSQLQALRASDVPAAAKSASAALIDRLSAPARIGIVGPPGSGKRRLLEALSGISTSGLDLPTVQLSHGPVPRTEAMLADGTLIEIDGPPTADILSRAPVLLKVETPVPHLAGRSLLLLVFDHSADDARAALAWAADKVDICLWCSPSFGASERDLWCSAPDRLRNHGILVHTGADELPGTQAEDEGFETGFVIGSEPDMADCKDLSSYLNTVVDEARTQDILAAQMVLQRYGRALPEAAMSQDATPAAPPAPPVSAEATAELSRLFQHLRGSADSLYRGLLEESPGDEVDTVLDRTESILSALSDRAADLDGLQEQWPDLGDLLLDARDLALLLRMEGGQDRATDAARLLLQVRQDMEVMLAA